MVDYGVKSGRSWLLLFVVVVDYAVIQLVQDSADFRPIDLILRRVVVDRLVKGKREVFSVNMCTLVIGQIFLFLIMSQILFIVHSDALVLRVGFVTEPHHLQLSLLVLNRRTGSGSVLRFSSCSLELRHKLFLLRVRDTRVNEGTLCTAANFTFFLLLVVRLYLIYLLVVSICIISGVR